MSRVVTYLTSPASDVNDHVKMSRGMVLMMAGAFIAGTSRLSAGLAGERGNK